MEVIRLIYTESEKLEIAKSHLLEKQIKLKWIKNSADKYIGLCHY